MPRKQPQPPRRKMRSVPRAGRPSAANVGEVDIRLLDAATQLFLELGFETTSCDQIAALAGAGKGSLYARYANKEQLFAAVVRRKVEQTPRSERDIPADLPLAERLRIVGLEILHNSLRPDTLAMMRLVISTATRFPELAQFAEQIGWEGAVARVMRVIAARTVQTPDEFARAKAVAAWFVSLTFAPHQMRALLGDSYSLLEASAATRVDDAVNMLSRGGWLNGWE